MGKKEFLPGVSANNLLLDKLDDTLLWPIIEPVVEGLMEIMKRSDWKLALVELALNGMGLTCCANTAKHLPCLKSG